MTVSTTIRIEQKKRRRHDRPFGLCEVCATVLPDIVWRVAIPARLRDGHPDDGGWIVEDCCSEQCANVTATSWAVSGGPVDG